MNTRSMRAPRSVNTAWPQTIQMPRHAQRSRARQHPYGEHRRTHVADVLCWLCVLTGLGALMVVAWRALP